MQVISEACVGGDSGLFGSEVADDENWLSTSPSATLQVQQGAPRAVARGLLSFAAEGG